MNDMIARKRPLRLREWLSAYHGLEYEHALPFGEVRLSSRRLFWQNGRDIVDLDDVRQISLQECDAVTLALSLANGESLHADIGAGEHAAAAALLEVIRERFPQIAICP